MYKKYLLIIAASVLSSLLMVNSAFAQGEEITVSPSSKKLEKTLEPDTTYNQSFIVINSGDKPVNINVYVSPYSVEDESYTPNYNESTEHNKLVKWITVSKTHYSLEKGQKVTIPYTITTPSSLPGGDQYAVLMAEVINDNDDKSGVSTTSRVGSRVIARTNGETHSDTKAAISSIPSIVIGDSYKFTTKYTNNGNIDIQPKMKVDVTNKLTGNTTFDNKKITHVLPDTSRLQSIKWTLGSNIGLYKVTVTSSTSHGNVTKTKNVLAITVIGIIALSILVIILFVLIVKLILNYRNKHLNFD